MDADAELAAADAQAAALLAALPLESRERLRPLVVGCRAMLLPRLRHLASGCSTESSGWAELFGLAQAGALAELDYLEALWLDEEEPRRAAEIAAAMELLGAAAGVRVSPEENESADWWKRC
jgi:hypothetical protein